MLSRKLLVVFAATLAVGSLAVAPGCNWLSGSDSGSRLSPFISSLIVSPSAVLCGQKFSVSFRYDDPQGDIANALVTLQRSGDTAAREEAPAWPAGISTSSGTAKFDFTFPCADSKGGVWSITVRVQDERGHISNSLTGTVRLTAAG